MDSVLIVIYLPLKEDLSQGLGKRKIQFTTTLNHNFVAKPSGEKMATEIYANVGLALNDWALNNWALNNWAERSKTRRETGTYKTSTDVKRIKYTVYRQNH